MTAVLTTGLDILRILAEAEEPLTATAIADAVGLHVSNVSRTLRVLQNHGYVRKPSYHSFAADLGVLALAGSAATRLPLLARSREAIRAISADSGLQATLAALHQDQVLYLHRCPVGAPCISAVAGGFPLHRSVVGLRLILDLPEPRGLALLAAAGRRYGWEHTTASTPLDPPSCLRDARARLRGDILRTDHWDSPGECAAAISISVPDQPPLALSLDGVVGTMADHTISAHLERARKHLIAHLESTP